MTLISSEQLKKQLKEINERLKQIENRQLKLARILILLDNQTFDFWDVDRQDLKQWVDGMKDTPQP